MSMEASPVGTASAHFCNKVECLWGHETVPLFNTYHNMQVMCIKCYTSYKCTDFNVHPSCPPYTLKDMCDVIHTYQQL